MSPTLVAVAGPLQGSSRPLDAAETAIGRDLSNAMSIADASVSRRHCLIEAGEDGFAIRDLESLNGTFVNGVPVKRRRLRNGDQIQVGNSLFLFVQADGAEPADGSVSLDEGDVRLGSTARLRAEAADPACAPAAGVGGAAALLKASRLIASAGSPEELARGMLDLALEVSPADRAAILFSEAGSEDFSLVLGRSRSAEGGGPPVHVSRTVVSRVLREKEGILANEVLQSPALAGSESLAASPVRSLAAVPLLLERSLGVLYVDASDPGVAFTDADLQALMGLGHLAAAALARLSGEAWREAERAGGPAGSPVSDLVGESAAMRRVEQFLARVSSTDATVLLLGESGTGKELAAQAIHRNSPRARRPFVAVNCAALSETLLESELFGHERGAFTGAIAQKRGRFEVADGGTVFLDEIGELTPALQAKLLRVLEQRQFERVGGLHPIRVDIRLVAATNRNLEQAIADGRFREDLYYRLNVVALTLPPLRERPEDIPLLAAFFAARFARKLNRNAPGFSPAARACLTRYDWPGNVRELSNAIERAVVLGGDVIGTEDLPEAVLDAGQAGGEELDGYHAAVQQTKRRVIRKAVEEAGGNYTEAAKRLGVHPNYLHRLIRNLGMKGELRR